MKFVDEAIVRVQAGNGGRGCVSFRREKFIPRGGPDGGDGGKGGDVILAASAGRRTLYPFRFKRLLQAENGQPGQGSGKTGRKGQDLLVEVPPGEARGVADEGLLERLGVFYPAWKGREGGGQSGQGVGEDGRQGQGLRWAGGGRECGRGRWWPAGAASGRLRPP